MKEQDILAHARRCAPAESCGFVVRTQAGERYLPCVNISAAPEDYFRMAPEDWLRAETQGDIVALVHSHPGGQPYLSDVDRRLQVQSDLPWWLVCAGQVHKFRCVPHLTGRQFKHGVFDCYTLFRDAYHLAGIDMPDFHRDDDWWRHGDNLYLDNLETTGFYRVSAASAQPGDVLICCFGSSVPNHAAIYCGDGELLAGLGLSMEDTPDGKISQFLVAADRIAYINPANGNETPGFVMQGDQIIMNEAFLKYLSAPTITSGGNPPAFSLTPDGKLTAKNADISGHINAVSGSFTGEINATSGKFSGVIEAREFVGDICGSKVMQGVNIRATNDERSTSTRYTDSATYQIGKTITVMANCERNGGSGAITVTININGQVKTAEVIPYTAGLPAMYQTVVFSVYTTSPVVDISVSLRVRGQYTTSASVWPLVMVSRSGNNFTN